MKSTTGLSLGVFLDLLKHYQTAASAEYFSLFPQVQYIKSLISNYIKSDCNAVFFLKVKKLRLKEIGWGEESSGIGFLQGLMQVIFDITIPIV